MPTSNRGAMTRTEAQAALGKALMEIQRAIEELEHEGTSKGDAVGKDRDHFIAVLKGLDLLIRPLPVFHHCPDDPSNPGG